MEKRIFVFEWYVKKDRDKITRHNYVCLTSPTGDIGKDAKKALGIFSNRFGGLNKNIIISIQEVDEHGKSIGEPIKPIDTEEPVIMPTI